MLNNASIAAVFDEMADLLEITGANMFRVRAYRNAARAIHDLPESVQSILSDADRKLILEDLDAALKHAQPIQFPANIELVKKYYDRIQAALQ